MRSKENPARMLWQLFKATFLLSAFTFGGGFVIVSLMKKKFVEELKWLEEEEMLDITAIAQSSPGPIPINASVILGYRMCGVIGSLVAILGTSLPPMIIISVISVFYATAFLLLLRSSNTRSSRPTTRQHRMTTMASIPSSTLPTKAVTINMI